ncbi:MAG: hypothetical protein MK198_01745 [Gracilimonas sp.]|nr:hypothetical protein [Gracilimonas sp.]
MEPADREAGSTIPKPDLTDHPSDRWYMPRMLDQVKNTLGYSNPTIGQMDLEPSDRRGMYLISFH